MQYEWILDVLIDLKAFAVNNGLTVLAEQLDDTSLVAATEIAQFAGGTGGGCAANADTVVALYSAPAGGDNA